MKLLLIISCVMASIAFVRMHPRADAHKHAPSETVGESKAVYYTDKDEYGYEYGKDKVESYKKFIPVDSKNTYKYSSSIASKLNKDRYGNRKDNYEVASSGHGAPIFESYRHHRRPIHQRTGHNFVGFRRPIVHRPNLIHGHNNYHPYRPAPYGYGYTTYQFDKHGSEAVVRRDQNNHRSSYTVQQRHPYGGSSSVYFNLGTKH